MLPRIHHLRHSWILLVFVHLGLVSVLAAEYALVDLPIQAPHHDFLALYSAGLVVTRGQIGSAYDAAALSNFQHTLTGGQLGVAGYMPFLNPPFAAVLVAPLAWFSIAIARLGWLLVNIVVALFASYGLTASMPARRRLLSVALVVTTFPFYQTLAEGQWSIFLLAGSVAALYFARRHRGLLAGACLSVLWLKPQFALLALGGILLCRAWKPAAILVGLLAGFLVITLPFAGPSIDLHYLIYLKDVSQAHAAGAGAAEITAWQGNLGQTEGINGLFAGWFGQSNVLSVDVASMSFVLVTVLLYLLAFVKVRPGFQDLEHRLMLVASLGVGLLIDPHLFQQDVILLLLVLPILLPHAQHRFAFLVLVCALVDTSMIDILWPMHLFTVIVWVTTLLISAGLVYRRTSSLRRWRLNARVPPRHGHLTLPGEPWKAIPAFMFISKDVEER